MLLVVLCCVSVANCQTSTPPNKSTAGSGQKTASAPRPAAAPTREELDLAAAEAKKTLEAYSNFLKKYPETKRIRILSGEVSSSSVLDNDKTTWTVAVNGNAIATGLKNEDAVRFGVAETLPFARVVQKSIAGTWRTVAVFPTETAVLESVFDASKSGDAAKLEELLKVEPGWASIRDAKRGATPLHYAAANNRKPTAELLLSQGADVNAKDHDGKTPLHWAAEAGAKSVARQLLEHKADINAKDKDGKTPGQLARGFRIEDIEALRLAKLEDWTPRGDRVLGELISGYDSDSVSFSGDISHFAYKAGPQGSQKVIVDGHVLATSEFFNSLDFAPVTNELYYFVVRSRGSGGYSVSLVAGDRTIPADFYPGNGTEVFSSDGKHYAATGGNIVRTAGSGQVSGVSTIIVDGKVAGKYRDTSYPVFFPNGSSYAHIVLNDNDTMSLIVDGQIRKSFPKPTVPCSFIFNSSVSGPNLDGLVKLHVGQDGHLSYLVRDDLGWSVYVDDKRVASYGGVVWGSTASHWLSYEGSERGAWIMEYSFAGAKNGSSVAWWAGTEVDQHGSRGHWRVLLNGEAHDNRTWENPRTGVAPRISGDGKHLAYAAGLKTTSGEQEYSVVLDNTQFGPYADVWALALSEDGTHVAYAAKAKGASLWRGYLDGTPLGETYDSLYATAFIRGTASVAWTGERSGKTSVITNGMVLHGADQVMFGPVSPSEGLVKWVVRQGNSLVEVTAERE
jgi:hypothetical protein